MKIPRISPILISGLLAAVASGCGGDDNPVCGANATENPTTGECEGDVVCATGTVAMEGECVPDGSVVCTTGTTFDMASGTCVADLTGCAEGTVQVGDECVPIDDTLVGDVQEPAEPNDPDADEVGQIGLPAVGEMTTIEGCITPYRDPDGSGNLDPDLDTYLFTTGGPTLLDVTVDGLGGLVGGFIVVSGNDSLIDSGWQRYGVSLVADTARRQVFLPEAGVYAIIIGDSRGLLTGEGAGNADTCYFATVQNVALPAPTPLAGNMASGPDIGGDIQFYSLTAAEGDLYFLEGEAPSQAAQIGVTLVRNDTVGASHGFTGTGAGVFLRAGGAVAGDTIRIAVDNVIDYSLSDVPWTLDLTAPGAAPAPDDGSSVTLDVQGEDPGIYTDQSWLYFDVAQGEVVEFQLANPDGVQVLVANEALDVIGFPCGDCTDWNGWFQFDEAGRYYLGLFSMLDPPEATFAVTLTRNHVIPTAITLGTPLAGQALTYESGFHTLDLAAATWIRSQATGTSMDDDPRITIYPRIVGELDADISSEQDFSLAPGEELGAIVIDDVDTHLVRIRDGGGFDGDESYDLDVAERDYEDLGTVSEAAPPSATGLTIPAGGTRYVFAQGATGTSLDMTVTGANGLDAIVAELDSDEGLLSLVDDTGANATEDVPARVGVSGWIAFGVQDDASAVGGTFDIGGTAADPITYSVASAALTFTDICPGAGGPGVVHDLDDDDDGLSITEITLPFTLDFYGQSITDLTVSSNGWISAVDNYAGSSASGNSLIPNPSGPNGLIAPYWDDHVETSVCVYSEATQYTIQMQGADWWDGISYEVQVVIHDDASIDFLYGPGHELNGPSGTGGTAGIENFFGDVGTQIFGFTDLFSPEPAAVAPGDSWTFTQD